MQTFSGPAARIASSIASAEASGSPPGFWRGSVLMTWRVSARSGSKGARAPAMPVIERAPSEQPW